MKANIKKSISRKINTGQYENLVVTSELEINLDVNSESELQKAQEELTDKIIIDYKRTEEAVLLELGFSEKKAFIESAVSEPILNRKLQISEEIESEIFG